jgi:hypothetical protein
MGPVLIASTNLLASFNVRFAGFLSSTRKRGSLVEELRPEVERECKISARRATALLQVNNRITLLDLFKRFPRNSICFV